MIRYRLKILFVVFYILTLCSCSNKGYFINSVEVKKILKEEKNDSTLVFETINNKNSEAEYLIYFKINAQWEDLNNASEPQDSLVNISFYDRFGKDVSKSLKIINQYSAIEMKKSLKDEYANIADPYTESGLFLYVILRPKNIKEYISKYNNSKNLMYSDGKTVNNLIIFSGDKSVINEVTRAEVIVFNKEKWRSKNISEKIQRN